MLLKTDDQKLNMINITKRKLMTLANSAECLSTKIDNWVTCNSNNNYRKLRSSRISKSCQTMTDHTRLVNKSSHWSYEDTVLLENWMAEKPEPIKEENNHDDVGDVITEELENYIPEIEEPCFNPLEENILSNKSDKVNIIQPIIRMEGDIIEIEYCYDDSVDNVGDDNINNLSLHNVYCNDNDDNQLKIEKISQELRRKLFSDNNSSKHNTPILPSHKIADNRGLSPRRCQNYREFLVKQEDNNNNLPKFNEKINTAESDTILNEDNSLNVKHCDELNNSEFDEHRSLSQVLPEQQTEQKNNSLKQERSIMYERGSSARIRSINKEMKSEIKSFLSFRYPNKKNKSEKKIRKKYVTSEEGAAGPIWPAVLLTFDRGVSPGPPDINSDE